MKTTYTGSAARAEETKKAKPSLSSIKLPEKKTMKPVSRKTFQSHGKWIEKATRTEILVCSSCGSKYIKTRPDQVSCIKCIYLVKTS